MSSDTSGEESPAQGSSGKASSTSSADKQKEKARVSRTSLILWHAHQNDASAVRKLLEEDRSLVHARDYVITVNSKRVLRLQLLVDLLQVNSKTVSCHPLYRTSVVKLPFSHRSLFR